LLNSIQGTLQDLQQEYNGKSISTAVASQVSFLNGIFDKAQNAKNACEITDMLAVGIFSLDANEAVAQGIPRPKEKVSADLGSLINASHNISTQAAYASWDALYLSGSTKGFYALNKVARGANTIGAIGSTAPTTKQGFDEAKKLKEAIFKSRDKSCSAVPQKEIAIGEHAMPQQNITQATPTTTSNATASKATATGNNKTVITITGMDYDKLSALEQNIKACAIVKLTLKKFNTTQSTIEVTHTGTTDELLGLMLQTCKSNFKQSNITTTEDGIIALQL